MLNYNILHVENYHNDDTNVWVYKFDYEILKIGNKIAKVPRTVKIVASYPQMAYFAILMYLDSQLL